jgi:hypothetical protein
MAGEWFTYISYQMVGGCNQQSVVFHTVKNVKELYPLADGNPGIKIFPAGNTCGISGFPEINCS